MTQTIPRKATNPNDPRIKRTVKALGDSLMTLILEKGYDHITVQDITDRAEMSRTTFYLHFKTIDDLLFERMRVMYDDLTRTAEQFDLQDRQAAEKAMLNSVEFEHVRRYLSFYTVMLSDKGSMAFLLRLLDYLAYTIEAMLRAAMPPHIQPNIPLPMLAHMAAGAEIALVRWWVQHEMPHSPDDMAKVLFDAHANGLWWALGLETAAM